MGPIGPGRKFDRLILTIKRVILAICSLFMTINSLGSIGSDLYSMAQDKVRQRIRTPMHLPYDQNQFDSSTFTQWSILGQFTSLFDVPQAFLRSDADCDIFVYPPTGFSEFSEQLLKLTKMLYYLQANPNIKEYLSMWILFK